MRAVFRHPSSLAILIASFVAAGAGARQGPGGGATSEFVVLSRGQAVGSESVTVTESGDGWLISASGSLGSPFDQSTSRFQLRYTRDWRPRLLTLEGTQANQLVVLSTTVNGTTARTEGMQRGRPVNVTHQISPDATILPQGFYAAYEALAARLMTASAGSTYRLYVAGSGELGAKVVRVTPRRLTTPSGPIELRAFDMTFDNPTVPLEVEVWIDARGRLARLAIPASWFVMIRDDISSVMTRDETVKRPGDEELFIPGLGFALAATVSRPAGSTGRLPAVVLVGGMGRQDRDERVVGVPVFADLAAALSDAGFVVVRYDKRGVGRSGGRTESATLQDYAHDALGVVQWLKKRKDIDPKRIAVVGYAEGGAMALLAGSRNDDVAALCLVAAPGRTGREVTLEQQQHALSQSSETESAKQAKVTLQVRILDAVVKGSGWEGIAPELRHQADNQWFKSWLVFDPAKVMPKVKQPVLILNGSLDAHVPAAHADRLETLGLARKKLPATATQKVIVSGVNHLLVPATTGEEDEYPSLADAKVSPAVTSAIVDWLKVTLARKP